MKPAHNLIALPNGMSIADLLPAFRGVKYEVRIGTPNRECAGCGKPFTSARKRHEMRLYEVTDFPLVFSLYVCRHCRDLCRRGGDAREGILAAVQSTFAGWGNER